MKGAFTSKRSQLELGGLLELGILLTDGTIHSLASTHGLETVKVRHICFQSSLFSLQSHIDLGQFLHGSLSSHLLLQGSAASTTGDLGDQRSQVKSLQRNDLTCYTGAFFGTINQDLTQE